MKFLTTKQKQWLSKRTIKENEIYMFPRFGFWGYATPDYTYGIYIDINPFTKSLDREPFLVKEKINGFCKGNFYYNPLEQDFYLDEIELETRDIIEYYILIIFSFIPLSIYNCFKGGVKKIENNYK